MARFKVLKGVSHNIGHSFTSLMNYSVDDYVLGHILRFARESGETTLILDLVSGCGSPAELLRDPIRELPQWYHKMFKNMVVSSGAEMSFIHAATVTLTYDLRNNRRHSVLDEFETAYVCNIFLVDTRGRQYPSRFEGWWSPEKLTLSRSRRKWWNPCTWLVPARARFKPMPSEGKIVRNG